MDLLTAKASEIVAAVKGKKISAQEVTEFFFQRAKDLNPKINAFISFNESAIEDAQRIDQRIAGGEDVGYLAGLPVGVKDLLCTEGLLTTAASKMLHNFVPSYSATVVSRLKSQGAIVLGKTNLDEFAMGSSNENSYYGVVKNPWDETKVPGGSSGGSAAAVAARMCPVSIGTDTGGSIRQPASFCGISGLKPTYGRVSRSGIVAFASSLDQAGPMGTYAEDCALVLKAISGWDEKDLTTTDLPVADYAKSCGQSLEGMTVALPKEYFSEGVSPAVRVAVERAIEHLKNQGVRFIDVELPMTEYAVATYYVIASSEASSNLARYDGVRFGHRAKNIENLEDLYKKSRGEGFGSEVKRRIMLGTYALSSGYYDAYYNKACQVRKKMQEDFLKVFETADLILGPVCTSTAFAIGEKLEDPLAMYLNDIFTISTNLAGLPGMSVPVGYENQALPIGVQLMAKHFEEEKILRVAAELEKLSFQEGLKPNVY